MELDVKKSLVDDSFLLWWRRVYSTPYIAHNVHHQEIRRIWFSSREFLNNEKLDDYRKASFFSYSRI